MNQAQQIFNKHTKAGMIKFDPVYFRKEYPHLHSCILAAINEALGYSGIKSLVEHLWKQQSELITNRSILNCHCKGVHSIMLIEKPEHTIRLFVADTDHELWNNYEIGSQMTVAYHPHHCDITIEVVKGELLNKVIDESDGGVFLTKFLYRSKIKEDEIKFEEISKTYVTDVSIKNIAAGESIFLPANAIHTVACEKGKLTAWFVYEGKEDSNYVPYCYSLADLNKSDFSSLYQTPMKHQIEHLLKKTGLI